MGDFGTITHRLDSFETANTFRTGTQIFFFVSRLEIKTECILSSSFTVAIVRCVCWLLMMQICDFCGDVVELNLRAPRTRSMVVQLAY